MRHRVYSAGHINNKITEITMHLLDSRGLKQLFAGAMCCSALWQPAHAAWPNDKPVEVVVGFAAGGGTDLLARKVTHFMQKPLGEKAQFIVINKPGAGGEIATGYVARAAADGYTVAVVNMPGFLYLPMSKKSQYKTEDFRLVARIVDDPTVLIVRSDSKYNSLASILDALKREPGSVSFGNNGIGTNSEIAAKLISKQAKVKLNEVPYKGTAAQRTDLLGGFVDVAVVSASEVPELHNGKTAEYKAIAQLSKTRIKALSQVPTAIESGVPVTMSSERGFAVHKGVPVHVAQQLQKAIETVVRDPQFAAANPGDAPVFAYLPGPQWNASLNQTRKLLQDVLASQPK